MANGKQSRSRGSTSREVFGPPLIRSANRLALKLSLGRDFTRCSNPIRLKQGSADHRFCGPRLFSSNHSRRVVFKRCVASSSPFSFRIDNSSSQCTCSKAARGAKKGHAPQNRRSALPTRFKGIVVVSWDLPSPGSCFFVIFFFTRHFTPPRLKPCEYGVSNYSGSLGLGQG